MIGSSNRTCVRSRWTGQKPRCFGLNQENDYASKLELNHKSTIPYLILAHFIPILLI